MNAGGTGGGIAFHGQKGLGDGDADFGRIKANERAVAFDDLKGFGLDLGWGCRLAFSQSSSGHGISPEYALIPFTFAYAGANPARIGRENTGLLTL
jgi:hypothetical protein